MGYKNCFGSSAHPSDREGWSGTLEQIIRETRASLDQVARRGACEPRPKKDDPYIAVVLSFKVYL